MLSSEKMFEMMNPLKAFEAVSQGNLFDVKAQVKLFESVTEQAFQMVGAFEAQTRKLIELFMDQSEVALKDNQRLMKDWTATMIKTNSEMCSDVQATVKEAAKVFEVPKSTKAAHAA
jgi:hypothetical protein